MQKIKIILVDDHIIVRDGLKILLSNLPDIEIIGEAEGRTELIELLKSIKPDIILMDISLPKISGIEITKQITYDFPDIKVIMLTENMNDESVYESFKAGANGYLPKNIEQEELITAIKTVYEGKEYISKYITSVVMQNYISRAKAESIRQPKNIIELSKREIEIIKFFAEGLNYKEVAEKLNISSHTVESHKKNIFEKLELNTIVDLVKYAIRHEIISI